MMPFRDPLSRRAARRRGSCAFAFVVVLLAACGGGGSDDLSGPAANGKDLFDQTVLAGNAGCSTCHSLAESKVLVGPSLAAIGADAGGRVSGMSATDYLRTSIEEPDSYVVEGFEAGAMPENWAEVLTADEITALVDYMATLGTD